jgi:hypothetical protein
MQHLLNNRFTQRQPFSLLRTRFKVTMARCLLMVRQDVERLIRWSADNNLMKKASCPKSLTMFFT